MNRAAATVQDVVLERLTQHVPRHSHPILLTFAHLHGKTLRQRTEALIQIAHPDFRQELMDAARKSGILNSRATPAPVGM